MALVGTTLVAFGAAEAYLRFFDPVDYLRPPDSSQADDWRNLLHRKSEVVGLAYELTPSVEKFAQKVDIKTNSHGMRDAEPRELDADTSSRIVALGDSFTFGFGAAGEDVWPMQLERMLDALGLNKNRPLDVLNFGVGGYGTIDESLVLKHKAMAWEPDLVVLAYFLNDPEDEPIQPLHAHHVVPSWWQYSHLMRLGHRNLKQNEMRELGGGDYHRYLHAHEGKWAGVVQALNDMRRVTSEAGCEMILMIFPQTPKQKWEGYKYEDLHSKVTEAGKEAGMHVIDLLPKYKQHAPPKLRVSKTDGHPNAKGHQVAARVLSNYLKLHPELLLSESER